MSVNTSHGRSRNIYSNALDIRRRPGQGLKVALTNVDTANAVDVRVEAAAGAADTFEVHDFSVATVVHQTLAVAAEDLDVLVLGVASALHTNYRVQVRSNASGLAADWSVYAQAGTAVEAD